MNFTGLEQTWVEGGGTPGEAPLMAGIALAESGGTPGAVQQGQPYGTTGWGLWQITPGNSEPQVGTNNALLTPVTNAKAAVAKFDAAQAATGTGLSPWATDRTWKAWQAAGAPADPSPQQVSSYVTSWGGSAGKKASLTSFNPFSGMTWLWTWAHGHALPSTRNFSPIPGAAIGSAIGASWSKAVAEFLVVGAGAVLIIFGLYKAAGAPGEGAAKDAARTAAVA